MNVPQRQWLLRTVCYGTCVRLQFSEDWQPEPPASYAEALHRQQRLIHGPERRAYLHTHIFVKEAVFAIIAAAQDHDPPAMSQAPARAAAPWSPNQSLNKSLRGTLASLAPAPSLAEPLPAPQEGGPGSFMEALVMCVHRNTYAPKHDVLQLINKPGYERFLGHKVGVGKWVIRSAFFGGCHGPLPSIA